MGIVFTSFDALLPSTDVFSTLIDATLFAIDGMSDDPRRPAPPGTQFRWQQGATEFSISPMHQMGYQTLANLVAGLQINMIIFGSIRSGMYATRFDIYIMTGKIGSGKIVSRPPSLIRPTSPSTPNNTARALTSPPADPSIYRVPGAPVTLFLSRYSARFSLPDALYLLSEAMFGAAGTIRDSGHDVLIGHSWQWRQYTIGLDVYPKPHMSWRVLAEAVKGMKDWLIAYGGMGFRFDIELDGAGHIGVGSLRGLSGGV
ncbi:MAG: hypothetical protein Q9195_004935 [Heterodermia aff. obscurata]